MYGLARRLFDASVRPSAAPHHPGSAVARPSSLVALALLGAAQFMLIIDVTVVNVALPSIGQDLARSRCDDMGSDRLHPPLRQPPPARWTARRHVRPATDLPRRHRPVHGGLGGVRSGASDGNILIISRALQGIGAALMSPAALSMVTTIFQGSDRNRALGVWAALGGGGAAFGVVLGGVLAAGPGWQWIFFVNVPVGIAVAIGVSRIIPAAAPDRDGAGIDLPGVLLSVPAIALALYAFVGAGDAGWLSAATLVPLVSPLRCLAPSSGASARRGRRSFVWGSSPIGLSPAGSLDRERVGTPRRIVLPRLALSAAHRRPDAARGRFHLPAGCAGPHRRSSGGLSASRSCRWADCHDLRAHRRIGRPVSPGGSADRRNVLGDVLPGFVLAGVGIERPSWRR